MPTPRPINVNMFKLRVTRDRHPRTKNGQPPQSTTGVAKINSNHSQVLGEANRMNGDTEGAKSDMPTSRIGIVSTVQIQNLLVMFTNSGFFSSSAVTVLGSRAMPQIGHEPGLSRTIWGCMGHVYSVLVAGAAATTGSSAMPHFGQSPGPCWRTSGSMQEAVPVQSMSTAEEQNAPGPAQSVSYAKTRERCPQALSMTSILPARR